MCDCRHAAAVHGCYQVCKWLLKVERVPASPVDKFGRTPLAVGPRWWYPLHARHAPRVEMSTKRTATRNYLAACWGTSAAGLMQLDIIGS